MNRFDRITAILVQLQTRRVVSGPALAEQFGVSLRTIYRNLRTLELAGRSSAVRGLLAGQGLPFAARPVLVLAQGCYGPAHESGYG